MARTKQTARQSTNGRAPRNALFGFQPNIRPCSPPQEPNRGKWFLNTIEDWNERRPSLKWVSHLPVIQQRSASQRIGLIGLLDTETLIKVVPQTKSAQYASWPSERDYYAPPANEEYCPLLELPDELLAHIMRSVVPTGAVFRVTRTNSRWIRGELLHDLTRVASGTVIHKLVPAANEFYGRKEDETAMIRNLTGVAAVCRRLHGIYCETLYGGNQFVYELSAAHVMPAPALVVVDVSRETGTGGEGDQQIESWYCWHHPTDAPWPLNARTARYIRHLFVSVNPGRVRTDAAAEEISTALLGELKQVFRLFILGHGLRRLAVDIDFPGMDIERVLVCERSSYGKLKLSVQGQEGSPEVIARVKELWDTVGLLRNVREVELTGLIREEDALAIAEKMREPGERS